MLIRVTFLEDDAQRMENIFAAIIAIRRRGVESRSEEDEDGNSLAGSAFPRGNNGGAAAAVVPSSVC